MKKIISIAAIALAIFVVSCKTKKATTETAKSGCATTPTYTADIKPILDASCGNSCHSAQKRKAGIDLSSYESSKEIGGQKRFLGAIRHEQGFDAMPAYAAKLDDATIQKIACWVEGGMPQ